MHDGDAESTAADAPATDLQRHFWVTVAALNVALLAVSLAAMLAYFRGQWLYAAALAAVAVVAGARAVRSYRRGTTPERKG